MPIDFSKFGTTNLVDSLTDPVKLFSALPRAGGGYTYLRNVQDEVLKAWFARRTERDIVLKMNTGAGKTVVGLLMLKSSLNEGAGPAAYITPDKFLTDQVEKEAEALGIAVTSELDQQYLSGKAILVHNISKVINGRSKFGIIDRTPLGTIVIDDAHSCLRIAEEQFTIKLPPKHEAYKELFDLFRPSLEEQSMTATLDIQEGDPTKLMVVPYWAWRDKQSLVTRILHKHRASDELEWPWPLLKDSLANCACMVGGRGMCISSRCLNIQLILDFESAKRRIYMTATLADDSALVTHFRANAKSVSNPVAPSSAADLGDRMILAPQALNPALDEDDVKKFVKWARTKWNVVVIVPSGPRAKFWEDIAAQTLTADNLAAGVVKMRDGLVGLTVLVNKYDGVDLPHDACRILVIDGLPEIDRWLDKDDANVLENSNRMLAKHVQRIEQGMGRGIRSNDDHCVVLLLGPRLVRRLGMPAAQASFTPATLAQVMLSRAVAEQLQGKNMTEIYDDAMVPCLTKNPQWVAASRAAVAGADYGKPSSDLAGAVHQREAFDFALLGRYSDAANEMDAAANAETDPRVKGWLKQQLADYTHAVDPVKAQQIQLNAQKNNRRVLRPIAGVEYVRLTSATPQAEALSRFLKATYKDGIAMVLGYAAILDDLVFRPDSFKIFEQAVNDLGEHLGFEAQRPEIEFGGKGPDNLWGLGQQRFVIIECKNEATAKLISKDYVDKSSGRRHWFTEKYGAGCTAASVMVHPSNVVSRVGSADPSLRILTPAKLEELKTAVRTLAKGISLSGFGDVAEIGKKLDFFGLTADKIVNRYTESFVMER